MYVYYCNTILKTAMKNISEKYMILGFTSLKIDFKIREINPGLYYIDKKHEKC